MRSRILVLTLLFAARAIHAQTDDQAPAPAPPPSGAAPSVLQKIESEKPKDKILKLLDVTRALARWTSNETSFLNVLDGVQERVTAAKVSDLAPMGEFMPYVSHLTAALSRMEARVSPRQNAAEVCDPGRKQELFVLYLDALDVEGQLPIQDRICQKLTSDQGPEGDLSQVCIGASLAFFAAKSIHDLAVSCEPSLARASDSNAKQIDRLSAELASVKTGVQDSVRAAKIELTNATTFAAGYMAEVSATQRKQLEDLTVRFEIERSLQQGTPYGSLYLPEASGGRLELVRTIVDETIGNVLKSGEPANGAGEKLAAGDVQRAGGHFKEAFRLYSAAYKTAVSPGPSSKQSASPPARN